jgi:thiamine biosynthesis lipoprotein
MGLRLLHALVVWSVALVTAVSTVCCNHGTQGQADTGVTSSAMSRPATSRASIGTLPAIGSRSRFEYTQIHMGVPVRLVVYATDETAAVNACRAAYARVRQIDDAASDYKKTSELNRLIVDAVGKPVKVSDDLWALLSESQRLWEISDGAFDITVGPLVQLWRAARQTKQLPSSEDIEEAKKRVGWRHVQLNEADRTVRLAIPGMKLDLGGIAKGYAGDQAIKVLQSHGVGSALYEGGGDIVVSGAPPGSDGWRIALKYSGEEMPQELTLADAAVSTSGDTEQYVAIGGKRYSHVVDPRTGIGLTSRSMGTVSGPRGIWTDGLSKVVTMVDEAKRAGVLKAYPGTRAWVRTVHE